MKADLLKAMEKPLYSVDFGKEFGLLVDASATAIGSCLVQWRDDGTENLFHSRVSNFPQHREDGPPMSVRLML
jgi:hypothetical protein